MSPSCLFNIMNHSQSIHGNFLVYLFWSVDTNENRTNLKLFFIITWFGIFSFSFTIRALVVRHLVVGDQPKFRFQCHNDRNREGF